MRYLLVNVSYTGYLLYELNNNGKYTIIQKYNS